MTKLPSVWRTLPLGSLLREPLRNGHSAKASGSKHGLPTLTLTAVTNGDFSDSNIKQTVAEPKRVRQLWIQPGDIFIQRSNTPALVGTARLYRGAPNLAIFPDLLIRVRLNDDADPRYIEAFLQSPIARAYFRKRAQGIAGSMPKIDQAAIEALPIPLAPKPEQLRVVDEIEKQLTRIDAGVVALTRVQANLRRYRASVLKAACEGRLVPTEAELARRESRDYEPAAVLLQRILKERRRLWEASELAKLNAKGKVPADDRWKAKYDEPAAPDETGLPRLPAGWCWASLEQLFSTLRNGISTVPSEAEGPPILRISAVRSMHVAVGDRRFLPGTPSDYSGFSLRRGDLLFTRYNGSPDFVGVCGVVPPIQETLFYPDKLIRLELVDRESAPFVAVMVSAGVSRAFIQSRIRTTAGQAGISGSDLRGVPVPLAPVVEQLRIVGEQERLFSLANALGPALPVDRAERLRQAILKAAFDGTLVPPSSLPVLDVERIVPVVEKPKKRRPGAELADV